MTLNIYYIYTYITHANLFIPIYTNLRYVCVCVCVYIYIDQEENKLKTVKCLNFKETQHHSID